jgi:hypothetical protein
LLQQIETLQDALWRHAVQEATGNSTDANPQPMVQPVRFNLTVCLPSDESGVDDNELRLTPPTGETMSQGQKRKYHRVKQELAPRTWRTRADPFEEVAVELQQWFLETPERTAQSMLQALQAREPERYPDSLLRTLQRRVRTWRSQVILEFDDRLLREDALLNQTLPTSLRAIPLTGQQTMMEVAVKP